MQKIQVTICKKVEVISAFVHLLPARWNVDEKNGDILDSAQTFFELGCSIGQRRDFSTDAAVAILADD